MDSLITAAARALAAGDPLGALKRVALRDDPPALARDLVAEAGQLLLLRKQRRSLGNPLVPRYDAMILDARLRYGGRASYVCCHRLGPSFSYPLASRHCLSVTRIT